MNRKIKTSFSVIIVFLSMIHMGYAQEVSQYSLFDLIQLSRTNSIAWLEAETRKENYYWQYKSFRSNYNPQMNLTGDVLNYRREFSPITQEDGNIEYRPIENNSSNIGLQMNQLISGSGTRIFAQSTIARFDNLVDETKQYSGFPFSVGFSQPIFQFNEMKWAKKIEPVRYEERQKDYFIELEQISIDVTAKFFRLMLAQINLKMAQTNQANNDTIYQIAKGRYALGKIGENDLLQLEANVINSELAVTQSSLDVENNKLDLKTYIGLDLNKDIELILPAQVIQIEIDETVALMEANKNRPDAVGFKRRMLEADRQIAKAKGDNGINFDLNASYGVSNRGASASEVYQDVQDQQSVYLTMNIPIVDWGRQKARIKTAQANQKLTQYQIQQERQSLEQEVLRTVRNFKILIKRTEVTKRSDDIEQRKYDISKQHFLIGKTDITKLNIALKDKDSAKRTYIDSLQKYWLSYFTLRQQTLYDFEKNNLLVRDIKI
jgi:outer membrane protein TolC